MVFVVDVGNTNMEFGVFEQGKLCQSFRLVTRRDITSDEVGLQIRTFFSIHGLRPEDVEDVVITNVVPQVMYSMKNAFRKYLGKEPLVVQENLEIPIVNRYSNPAEVGADRLVNSFAALRKYGAPLIVVDFGTATTFDVIDPSGAYLGGSIYPGIKVSLDALVGNTSKLPRVEIEPPAKVVGDNTVSSIQSGIVYGYCGAVIHMLKLIRQELGVEAKAVATGGLSGMIGRQTGVFAAIDKSLTLDGLELIYREGHRHGC